MIAYMLLLKALISTNVRVSTQSSVKSWFNFRAASSALVKFLTIDPVIRTIGYASKISAPEHTKLIPKFSPFETSSNWTYPIQHAKIPITIKANEQIKM